VDDVQLHALAEVQPYVLHTLGFVPGILVLVLIAIMTGCAYPPDCLHSADIKQGLTMLSGVRHYCF
jgi:hypothetical protein